MYNPLQSRALQVSSDALPTWGGQQVLIAQRVSGTEALGKLYEYSVELATLDSPTCGLWQAQGAINPEQLIGTPLTISIEFEGKGSFIAGLAGNAGAANLGAGTRTITGLITEIRSAGCDDRRAYYRFTVRPWLWIATQNRESRTYQNMDVVQVTETLLKGGNYPYPCEFRLGALGLKNGVYPKRDYIRQFWQSDYDFLTQIWREWGIYFLFDGLTLVLCDSPGSHKQHHNMYDTIRYHAPDGKRIDEEHIHRFKLSRKITAGDVTLNDYDYTRSRGRFDVTQSKFSKSTFDNVEQYQWGDYSQPLAGAMGLTGDPNDYETEGDYLARVRVYALRSKKLRVHGRGNLRGLSTGKTFWLEGHPQQEANAEYLVVSTSLDIHNPDEVSQTTGGEAQYKCVTDFVLQPANSFFKNRPTEKPRAYPETAVVVGAANQPVWLDGYARIKIKFVWDRLGSSDENSSCWVRVSLPWHGGPHSFIAIPRIGDELTIGYHGGDPDKPYVAASKVNQFNQPPFELPKNQALTGLVSNGLDGRGNNFVITDDTPGQLQVQVASDQASSRLVLGYNTRVDYRTGRQSARGLGWELATDAWGVLRANQGMLVTTESGGASGAAKAMSETVDRLGKAQQLHDALTKIAQQNEAQDAQGHQSDIVDTIASQNEQIRGAGMNRDNPFPELPEPHLVIDGKAGVEITTPATVHVASQQLAVTTEGHIGIASGRSFFATVRDTIRLFTQTSPIQLVTAAGDIVLNALTKSIVARAQKQILLESEEILLRAKTFRVEFSGGFLNMDSSGIVSGTTGKFIAYAASHALPGPKDQMVDFSPKKVCIECLLKAARSGTALIPR